MDLTRTRWTQPLHDKKLDYNLALSCRVSADCQPSRVQSVQQVHSPPVTAQRWVPCSRPAMAATPDRPEDTFCASSNTILHHLKHQQLSDGDVHRRAKARRCCAEQYRCTAVACTGRNPQHQLIAMLQASNTVCRPGRQQGALSSLVLLCMPQLPLHKQSWRVVDLHERAQTCQRT